MMLLLHQVGLILKTINEIVNRNKKLFKFKLKEFFCVLYMVKLLNFLKVLLMAFKI